MNHKQPGFLESTKMSFEQSKNLLDRAWQVIPSATQTFSKGPNQWVQGVGPNFLDRGEGAWVWDVDGNKYLDYLMALGPIILGYGDSRVETAVIQQLKKGAVFSQMAALEVEVAELIVDLVPCAEMVRFAKNGSDATTGAIRAARSYTGRDHIACSGYHGWHDWYIGTTTRSTGVPQAVQDLSHTFVYNDIASLEAVFNKHPNQIAAIVMEPVGVEDPKPGYLEAVRELTRKHGALLIFDEIVTGFRFSLGGAQEYYGVNPDIACIGKGMANGLPISAVVGPREIMQQFDKIFFSGTFGGEALSLAACKATILAMQEDNVIAHIWDVGQRLIEKLSALIDQYQLQDSVKCLGLAPRSVLAFPHVDEYQMRLRRSYFMQECIKRGLLYFCSQIPCAAHGEEELAFTFQVFEEVMPLFADALANNAFEARLEGKCVEAIFRKA